MAMSVSDMTFSLPSALLMERNRTDMPVSAMYVSFTDGRVLQQLAPALGALPNKMRQDVVSVGMPASG